MEELLQPLQPGRFVSRCCGQILEQNFPQLPESCFRFHSKLYSFLASLCTFGKRKFHESLIILSIFLHSSAGRRCRGQVSALPGCQTAPHPPPPLIVIRVSICLRVFITNNSSGSTAWRCTHTHTSSDSGSRGGASASETYSSESFRMDPNMLVLACASSKYSGCASHHPRRLCQHHSGFGW